jgi:hypothetical protein
MTDEHDDGAASEPAEDSRDARHRNASTGSMRPALAFGFVMATLQMALLLWLLYC